MGSQQQFCLRWNNHQSNMLSVFDDLFQNEALVDVTLACDGLSIKAHKMVLSACSPYFQNLFLDNPCKHPIVILKDIRFTDLKALMDFMYKGEVNVSQEQLSTLLRTAETLKVRGLTEVAAGGNGTAEMNNSLLPQTSSSTQGNQNVLPVQLPRPPNGTNTTTTPSQPPVSTATNNIQHQQPIQIPPPSNRSTCSPSPKRKRVRHWHKPDAGSSASDYEDSGDSRGHELIEPKVEITEELPDGEEPPAKSDTGGGKSGSGGRNATTSTATNASGAMDCSSGGGGGSGAGGSKSNTQGVPSSHEASPVNDSQNSLARSSSINTTPVIFGQQPPSLAQTIGQPPVLQGTSQVYVVCSCREGDSRLTSSSSVADGVLNPSAGNKKPKGGRPTILYEEEEDDIVTFINHQALEGMPVDFKQILAYGNGLLRRQGRRPTGNMYCDPSKGLSVKWWRGFKKRHPGLPYLRLK